MKRCKKSRKFFNKIVKLIEVNVTKVIVLYCKKNIRDNLPGLFLFVLVVKKVNIINKSINELKPYDKNPRKNDDAVKYVAESIKQFGFKVPIIVDKNNVIVAGHTRYKAAKKLHIDEVPCIIADDLTDEQIKAFRLADNKVAEKAEWDFDLLGNELDDLFDFDMTVFGFEEDVGFEEVSIPQEKKDDAEAQIMNNYLKYGKRTIPISDEEIEILDKKFDEYSELFGTTFGFVRWLCDELR